MQDLSPFSKSCDDLVMTSQPTSRPHAEDTTTTETELDSPRVSLKQKKHKKFTFQSTVRQIERRRIAEKLSKQAEQKGERKRFEPRPGSFFYTIIKKSISPPFLFRSNKTTAT
jgi:hypothetical protein